MPCANLPSLSFEDFSSARGSTVVKHREKNSRCHNPPKPLGCASCHDQWAIGDHSLGIRTATTVARARDIGSRRRLFRRNASALACWRAAARPTAERWFVVTPFRASVNLVGSAECHPLAVRHFPHVNPFPTPLATREVGTRVASARASVSVIGHREHRV